MSKMKLCGDCLKQLRHKTRKTNKQLKPFPDNIYHDSTTKKCPTHHAQRLSMSASRRCRTKCRSTQEIIDLYKLCKKITVETGIEMVVDHIIPLKGKNVSGLHVINNLQIITKRENATKSNKFLG